MANLVPRLTPFWYTPEGQDDDLPAEFQIRPLSQPQLLEIEATYDESGKPTSVSWLRAAELGIISVRNLIDPDTGKPALWPSCKPRVPRELLLLCGAKLVLSALGLDDIEGDPSEPEKN